ncbi:MAG: hypothetical protein OEU92_16470 [Alphaproteobacteria bacterium]|nr:hypothetical protein [Alphaproteobacteria bacterium]
MFDRTDTVHWPDVVRPLAKAERALGRLAQALETTALHQAWLWRETTRIAAIIAQNSGYQVSQDQLRMALIGAPVDPDDNTTGLAAAKRIFLAAAPLFRAHQQADSKEALWPQFWAQEASETYEASDALSDDEAYEADGADNRRTVEAGAPEDVGGAGEEERARLMVLVREIAGFADDGRRPALVNLFVDLRRQAVARRLSPMLTRLALPLALVQAAVVPKAAPGLLGGRRLPLGMSRAAAEPMPLTDWLARGLNDLAEEARHSHRRLTELERQHRAWHGRLAEAGLRRHARAPAALDLLTATPVMSIGLVARHLACSTVAAGKIVERLVDLGILLAATSRSRHKVYIAGDLPQRPHPEAGADEPLAVSAPAPVVDVDAVGATLDGLFADLDRLNERTKTTLADTGR